MRFKITGLFAMLAVALVLAAQTDAPNKQAAPNQNTSTCACCNQSKAPSGSATGCNGCKDGKCPMMSGNASAPKCPMMAQHGNMPNGKMCCSGNKCPMHAKGNRGKGCCCGNMGESANSGM